MTPEDRKTVDVEISTLMAFIITLIIMFPIITIILFTIYLSHRSAITLVDAFIGFLTNFL